jgi:maltoporin
MTKNSKLAAALVLAFAAQSAMAGSVDFGGYLRSGSGTSSKNGKETCYRLNGDSALAEGAVGGAGRLGNECDTYGEIILGTTMGDSDGTKFGIHTLMAFGAQQNQDYEQSVPAWRESYATAQGFGSGALAKSTAWIGKRYYNRKDVHIVDMFWLQVSGPGAGLENVDVGVGKFSYALMRTGDSNWVNLGATDTQGLARATTINDPTKQKVNHDFRLEGINLGKAGSLSLGANLIRSNNASATGGDANGSSFWVSHSIVMGGVQNGLTFQSWEGAGSNDGNGLWWFSSGNGDHKGWRVLDAANFEFGEHINGQAFLGYGKEKFSWFKADKTSLTFVARPVYHFTDTYSVALEVGRASVKGDVADISAGTNYLNKITIAPQISMGSGFYARPVLRAYYTQASWNKGGASACTGRDCLVGVSSFGNETSGSSYGFQMEAWW